MGLQIVRSLVFTRNTAFPFIDNISSLFLFFFLGKPCAVDHYQNKVAQSSCKACVGCGKGQYTTCGGSTTQCTACTDGTFSDISAEAGIATSCKQCQSCGNGHFYETCSKSGDGNGCQPCEAGRYSTSSNHQLPTCVKCPVGYSTDGTAANVQCTECEEGKTLKHHPTLKCLVSFVLSALLNVDNIVVRSFLVVVVLRRQVQRQRRGRRQLHCMPHGLRQHHHEFVQSHRSKKIPAGSQR